MTISNLVKNLSITTIGSVFIALGVGATAQATVLTFDDIDTGISGETFIYNGYGGLNWNNMVVLNPTLEFDPSGYLNGVVSPNNVVYNAYSQVGTVGGTLFDFNGAYLTAAWNNRLSILVEGFKNGTSLYSRTVVVDADAPTWFNFNFFGVDQLKFTSSGGVDAGLGGGGEHFAMDNFTFNEPRSVPEPGTLIGLLGVAVLGTNSAIKRKQQPKAKFKA